MSSGVGAPFQGGIGGAGGNNPNSFFFMRRGNSDNQNQMGPSEADLGGLHNILNHMMRDF